MREYDEIADWYATARNPDVGVPEVGGLAVIRPPGASVLDLGCGDGVPLSRLLLRRGVDLAALDSSAEMVRRYRANLPGVPVQCVRIEDARFPPASFDAVVAWGVLFHLAEADQAAAIRSVATWLRGGGQFLFTSGAIAGVTESQMDGVTFRYVSLGADAYRHLVEGAGMRLAHHRADAWGNHVYVATKPAGPARLTGEAGGVSRR